MVKSTSRRRLNRKSARPVSGRKPAARGRASAPKAASGQSKWVYSFGNGKAEGRAEMANLGLPVPPGFTITTTVCTYYYENGKTYPEGLRRQVAAALAAVGRINGKTFGDSNNPLLVSVRSGARASKPGMMDTVLNLGLNDATVEALAKKSGDR